MFLISQLILLKNPSSLTEESLLLPRRASYEAEWFDVALRFVYLSLGEISSANILATILGRTFDLLIVSSQYMQSRCRSVVDGGQQSDTYAG